MKNPVFAYIRENCCSDKERAQWDTARSAVKFVIAIFGTVIAIFVPIVACAILSAIAHFIYTIIANYVTVVALTAIGVDTIMIMQIIFVYMFVKFSLKKTIGWFGWLSDKKNKYFESQIQTIKLSAIVITSMLFPIISTVSFVLIIAVLLAEIYLIKRVLYYCLN